MTTYVTDNERSFGLPPASQVTAAEQLQKAYPRVGIQPLPAPYAPGQATAQRVGVKDTGDKLKFLMIGDSGGIADATYQHQVAAAMVGRLEQEQDISFCYHVGDEVYFNGDPDKYAAQFYEPYAHFNRPIVGVPGNHDGSVAVDDAGNQTGRQPLDTFMANFCDLAPHTPVCDVQFEYRRHTQTQPSHDWTLNLQALTIVGLYSNVPSGGHLEPEQISWLTEQLKAANKELPLMLVLHHPPYSVDAHHGGSVHMGDAIDQAAKSAGVYPSIVVAGHVHNYQRFNRAVQDAAVFGADNGNQKYEAYVPYIVIGNSGYHNLHRLAVDAVPGKALDGGVMFEYGDASCWGFLQFTMDKGVFLGEYISIDKYGNVAGEHDTFVVGYTS